MRTYQDRKEAIQKYHRSPKGREATRYAARLWRLRRSVIAHQFHRVAAEKWPHQEWDRAPDYNAVVPEKLFSLLRRRCRSIIGPLTDYQLLSSILREILHGRCYLSNVHFANDNPWRSSPLLLHVETKLHGEPWAWRAEGEKSRWELYWIAKQKN